MRAAAPLTRRLQDIPPFDIVISFVPLEGGAIVTHRLRSCVIKNDPMATEQGKAVAKGRGMQFDIFLKDNCKLLNSPEFDSSDEHILGLLEWLGLIIKTVDGELGEL